MQTQELVIFVKSKYTFLIEFSKCFFKIGLTLKTNLSTVILENYLVIILRVPANQHKIWLQI